MKFNNIKVGMTLWDVRKNPNQWIDKCAKIKFPVHILEINPVSQKALISHNNNKPRWVSDRQLSKYVLNPKV
jgi:hypothetical protein